MPKRLPKANRSKAVEVTDCTISFGQHRIVDGASFAVEAGSVAAVIGPNGSGKTTLVRAILGLQKMDTGTVRLFGHPIADARTMVGYVPQRLDFDRHFPITVAEFMDLARHRHLKKSGIDETIDELGLPTSILQQHLGSLSGGQLQRVLIAQAILNGPDLLVLDEPSSGIDIVGEKAFYEIIRHLNQQHKTTVVMVSHELSVVSKLVDTIICLNHEQIRSGPPKKMMTASSIREIFGEQTDLFEHGHTTPKKKRARRSGATHRRTKTQKPKRG